MLTLDQLRERIALPDLAGRLGMVRCSQNGDVQLWRRKDAERPEISINLMHAFWRDARGQGGGHVLDLVMWAMDQDYPTANRTLHNMYYLHYLPLREDEEEDTSDTDKLLYIANKNAEQAGNAYKYLNSERGIPDHVIKAGIENRSLGWTNYINPKVAAGEPHHGGEAVSFNTFHPHTKMLAAVDYRYYDAELNGGMKTKSLGQKNGVFWMLDPRALREAQTVYVVEGPLDALSIEAAFWGNPTVCAIALRGTQVQVNWQLFRGKTIMSCYDKDEPKEDKRNPNGPYRCYSAEAEWRIHEGCLAAGVACFFVDRSEWEYGQDANDIWKEHKSRLKFTRKESWLIPGLAGRDNDDDQQQRAKPRIYLPHHDQQQYWRFRVKPDFISFIKISTNDEGEQKESYEDVAGYRVAGISKVEIASAAATMSGEDDNAPRVQFVALIQNPRHKAELQRKVMEDEQLHNLDTWRKLGPIFNAKMFSRMLNIFERTIGIGSVNAANFVGLCYLKGKPVVNEGKDCFFTEPKQQCPYSDFAFPRGMRGHAAQVIEAYQTTFTDNAAARALIWVIGAQLKLFLGFWPHLIVQAGKSSGKTTLVKRIERSTGMKMLSGQSMGTEYRLMTSVSGTSHPIGWEELSARKAEIIHRAVSLLQESYNYTETTRGSAQTPFLIAAPVLLAGEDVPVESLTGKTVRTDLSNRKGPLMPENLPKFPMYEWMQWLAQLNKATVQQVFSVCLEKCKVYCRSRDNDRGAERMVNNYAALMTAWRLARSFAGIEDFTEEFERDLITEMNAHIADTNNDRDPWIWIVEIIMDEIAAGRYPFPYCFEKQTDFSSNDADFLCIRVPQMMAHLSTSVALREKYNNMPVKTPRVLKQQLEQAGCIEADGKVRGIDGRRVANMQRLDLKKLEQYGITVTVPENTRAERSELL
ncbi:toprim domain-containing protein [Alteromonas sp. RKMC-009]|uniref:toprim domain-containing protein n=1 Tax=Alteromonas sp. RKMC-009 TaxID=2267264 RepID=UPI000E6969D8|nr:toprim domain-containing protein [Alteromonas sp. RKMC-009]AYA63848.1 hypothetical protein DS731_07440 [Alteromonas sp. RKMC-009]